MKIQFLGAGGAFCGPDQYQSNLLISGASGQRLLLDCGGDIRFALAEAGLGVDGIDGVYVSHLHADHIGGLEWLALHCRFGLRPRRLPLLCPAAHLERLWEHALRAGLEYADGTRLGLQDYFAPQPLGPGFHWDGIQAELVKMPHVQAGAAEHPSYGLVLRDDRGPGVFVSTDCQFAPEILLPIAARVDLIFQDCETGPMPSGVHARYGELRTLPDPVRARTWIYHHAPVPGLDARADGFAGLVQKGQVFDLDGITADALASS